MNGGEEHVLQLEPELTIYGAGALRERLAAALGALDAGVVVDLAGVCEIDSAGLQVLMAARRDADARGLALRFAGHAPAVLEAFALCGLDQQAMPQGGI